MRRSITLLAAALCFCVSAFAQDVAEKPKIAVYVTGQDAGANKALAVRLLEAFVTSDRYAAIERSDAFVAQIDKEMATQHSGAVDDEQIRELGKQAGAQFVCVADITQALGTYQISARIIHVETASVVAIGVHDSRLKIMDDLVAAANSIVGKMFGEEVEPKKPQKETPPPKPQKEKAVEGRKFDWYIAPKLIGHIGEVPIGVFNIEGGVIWGSGSFVGLNVGGGDYYDDDKEETRSGGGFMINYGRPIDVSHILKRLRLEYGISLGAWIMNRNMTEMSRENPGYSGVGFAGPFIRIRWRFIEIAYSGLIGSGKDYYDSEGYGSDEISYTSQLMFGLHFATSKRQSLQRSASE
jgi:hypothetical protein